MPSPWTVCTAACTPVPPRRVPLTTPCREASGKVFLVSSCVVASPRTSLRMSFRPGSPCVSVSGCVTQDFFGVCCQSLRCEQQCVLIRHVVDGIQFQPFLCKASLVVSTSSSGQWHEMIDVFVSQLCKVSCGQPDSPKFQSPRTFLVTKSLFAWLRRSVRTAICSTP